jgi:hypothetical protein
MSKIYSKATRVLVWLGETADNSDMGTGKDTLCRRKRLSGFSEQQTNPASNFGAASATVVSAYLGK